MLRIMNQFWQILGAAAMAGIWAATVAAAEDLVHPPELNGGGAAFWVATTGADDQSGTADHPFATLQRAQLAARKAGMPVTIHLRGGPYYLAEPLILTAADSFTTYAGEDATNVILSGGESLRLQWQPYSNNIVVAAVPAGFTTDQLFANGQPLTLARYPNYDPQATIYHGTAADAFSPARTARWAAPQGGYLHALHSALWGSLDFVITGKNAPGSLAYEGGWQNNRPAPPHARYRFVENIFEELDAPGEWFLNTRQGRLYLIPPAGLDLAATMFEGVRLKQLVEFHGAPGQPVKNVHFQHITFARTTRTFMDTRERLLRTDWAIYRGGAVLFNGAEDCSLEDCVVDQPGGNAVFVNRYNRRVTLRGCHIFGAGANGVAFVGNPAAARNGLTGYEHRQAYTGIDRTPGPASDNYPADCLVEDCLIHDTGRIEKQSAPVAIDLARRITVRHCSIYDVPRAGINIGDGCWGGHLIEDCDIFDTVRETGDHGSFNAWGRDRYWMLQGVPAGALPALALLDATEPNVLRHNRWRCDHGWDIDLDDGSSNYQIYDNLLLHGGLKLREGFYRVAANNITVNNSLHPHVWFADSGDVVTHNLFMGAYRPAAMSPTLSHWGQLVDSNFFSTTLQARDQYRAKGCDAHSLAGDPQFVNPAAGDYRVRAGSPAFQVGFTNFAMDQFGVVSPGLRALARTPALTGGPVAASTRDNHRHDWQGLVVKNIVGEDEISAYGTAGESGVLVLEVAAGLPLAQAGLAKGDVIVAANGQPVDDFAGLRGVKDLHELGVLRSQKRLKIPCS